MRAYTLALFTKLSGGKALEDKDIVDWANAKVIFAHRFLYSEQNKAVWLFVSRGVFRSVVIATTRDYVTSVYVGFRRKARSRKAILDVLAARKVGREQKMREGGVEGRKGEIPAIEPKDCECSVRVNIDANLLKWWNPIFLWSQISARDKTRGKEHALARRGAQRYCEGRVEHVDFSRPSEFFFNIQTVTCLGITRWLVSSFWILQFRQIIILFTVARSRQIQ